MESKTCYMLSLSSWNIDHTYEWINSEKSCWTFFLNNFLSVKKWGRPLSLNTSGQCKLSWHAIYNTGILFSQWVPCFFAYLQLSLHQTAPMFYANFVLSSWHPMCFSLTLFNITTTFCQSWVYQECIWFLCSSYILIFVLFASFNWFKVSKPYMIYRYRKYW